MVTSAFVIPGDIDLPTGGYAYDRQVLARLPAHGVRIGHVALPSNYPFPGFDDLERTSAILGALPADTVLLIDGLAFGAMPNRVVSRIEQPIVALCHHPLALEAGLEAGRRRKLRATETAALALARHVIVTSPTTARTLVTEYNVPTERITVAIPGTVRAARATGTICPMQLLAVGSIIPRKGYDVLIQALVGLTDRDWQLGIVGSDQFSPDTGCRLRDIILRSGLDSRVRLLGTMNEADLSRLYAAADVFVMPSLYEGFGMVLTEAMARGLPIVCTTGGAAAETVPDSAAIKVSPGDVLEFRTALASVLDDVELRRRMADAAWVAAQRLPTWDDTARIIADVIRKVAV